MNIHTSFTPKNVICWIRISLTRMRIQENVRIRIRNTAKNICIICMCVRADRSEDPGHQTLQPSGLQCPPTATTRKRRWEDGWQFSFMFEWFKVQTAFMVGRWEGWTMFAGWMVADAFIVGWLDSWRWFYGGMNGLKMLLWFDDGWLKMLLWLYDGWWKMLLWLDD